MILKETDIIRYIDLVGYDGIHINENGISDTDKGNKLLELLRTYHKTQVALNELTKLDYFVCSQCNRKTYSGRKSSVCGMTQPSGIKCNGLFNYVK